MENKMRGVTVKQKDRSISTLVNHTAVVHRGMDTLASLVWGQDYKLEFSNDGYSVIFSRNLKPREKVITSKPRLLQFNMTASVSNPVGGL